MLFDCVIWPLPTTDIIAAICCCNCNIVLRSESDVEVAELVLLLLILLLLLLLLLLSEPSIKVWILTRPVPPELPPKPPAPLVVLVVAVRFDVISSLLVIILFVEFNKYSDNLTLAVLILSELGLVDNLIEKWFSLPNNWNTLYIEQNNLSGNFDKYSITVSCFKKILNNLIKSWRIIVLLFNGLNFNKKSLIYLINKPSEPWYDWKSSIKSHIASLYDCNTPSCTSKPNRLHIFINILIWTPDK